MSVYDVGYGKPPKTHRYKKGQSGNPKGRPKPAIGNSILEDIQEELKTLVLVSEGGKQIKITKQKLLVKAILKKAAEANPHALKQLNQLTDSFKPTSSRDPQTSFRMTSTGMKIIDDIMEEVLGRDASETSRRTALDDDMAENSD